jgi:thioredoxin 1
MAHKHIIPANDLNFDSEVLQSDVPVLVDFMATWCGPCRTIAPLIEQLAEEYEGKAKFAQVDIDESPSIAQRFGIRGVPTLYVFKGGEMVGQLVGAAPKPAIASLIQRAL